MHLLLPIIYIWQSAGTRRRRQSDDQRGYCFLIYLSSVANDYGSECTVRATETWAAKRSRPRLLIVIDGKCILSYHIPIRPPRIRTIPTCILFHPVVNVEGAMCTFIGNWAAQLLIDVLAAEWSKKASEVWLARLAPIGDAAPMCTKSSKPHRTALPNLTQPPGQDDGR